MSAGGRTDSPEFSVTIQTLSARAGVDLARVYRAHVSPYDWRGTERTAFVEASSSHGARKKIAAAVSALEYSSPAQVEDRIYNVKGALECIAEGLSPNPILRVFETGWSAELITYVEEPLFLLGKPALFVRTWAQIPARGLP